MAYQGQAPMAGVTPATAAEERKLAKEVNEEYHDPFDDWSSRDLLLALVPLIVTIAFKDTDLHVGLNFAIAFSGLLLILRTVTYDSRRKEIWPIIDLTSLITFAILRGLCRHYTYWIQKWWITMVFAIFASVAILTLLRRRPFTAHYARFPKFDRGGRGLWHGDAAFRRTADLTTLGFIGAWIVGLFLALIPNLTGNWVGWNALNVIFNYVLPFVFMLAALIFHQMMGAWYRSSASRHTTTTTTTTETAGYPAGAQGHHHQQPGATYATAV